VTSPGIDPETVRLVAQCLNHYRYPRPHYSLSDDSYSDTSDNNSSFDEVNVPAFNEHNIDLTTENENRRSKSRKRKTAVQSE
jgi:dipeptidase